MLSKMALKGQQLSTQRVISTTIHIRIISAYCTPVYIEPYRKFANIIENNKTLTYQNLYFFKMHFI